LPLWTWQHCFVTQLEALPDILAVTETKTNSNTNFMYNTRLPSYNFVHVDTDKNAEDIGLYVKEHTEFLVLDSVNIENEDCENLWVELKLSQRKYAVGVVINTLLLILNTLLLKLYMWRL